MAEEEAAEARPGYRRLVGPSDWFRGYARHLRTDRRFAPLRKFFPIPRDTEQARAHHRRLLHQSVLNQPLNDALADSIGAFARDGLAVPTAAILLDAETRAIAEDAGKRLRETGWASLPAYDNATIAPLYDKLAACPVHVREKSDPATGPLTPEAARDGANIAEIHPADLLRIPEVVDLATAPDALAAAERYLGAPPMAIALTAWWSFAGKTPKDAQLFHLDFDDHRFCKQFLFLTDVDADSGPHAFVERTHRAADLAARIQAAGDTAAQRRTVDWLFRTPRKTDADVERFAGRKAREITGPAGTRFLAATRALHKGVAPRRRDRLLLQVTYGITPCLQGERVRLPREEIPAEFLTPPRDHALWLYLS